MKICQISRSHCEVCGQMGPITIYKVWQGKAADQDQFTWAGFTSERGSSKKIAVCSNQTITLTTFVYAKSNLPTPSTGHRLPLLSKNPLVRFSKGSTALSHLPRLYRHVWVEGQIWYHVFLLPPVKSLPSCQWQQFWCEKAFSLSEMPFSKPKQYCQHIIINGEMWPKGQGDGLVIQVKGSQGTQLHIFSLTVNNTLHLSH